MDRAIWNDVGYTEVSVVYKGDEICGAEVETDLALLLHGDDTDLVIEGPKYRLQELLIDALNQLNMEG